MSTDGDIQKSERAKSGLEILGTNNAKDFTEIQSKQY